MLRSFGVQRCRIDAVTDHAIVVADADGTITWWSPGAEVLFGDAAAAVGQKLDLIAREVTDRATGLTSSGRCRRLR
jgi:PAS domain-containing protein